MEKFSNSQLDNYKSCTRKYYYTYKKKIQTKKIAIPLELGGLVHKCLEIYYSFYNENKFKGQDAVMEYLKFWGETRIFKESVFAETYEEILTKAEKMMKEYFIFYKDDLEIIEILGVEKKTSFQPYKDFEYVLTGYLDVIVRTPSGIFIMDHKTSGQKLNKQKRLLSTQPYFYLISISEYQKKYGDVKGFIYNFLSSQPLGNPKLTHGGKFNRTSLKKCSPEAFRTFINNSNFMINEHPHKLREIYAELKLNGEKTFERYYEYIGNENLIDFLKEQEPLIKGMHKFKHEKEATGTMSMNYSACNLCEFKELCFNKLEVEKSLQDNAEKRILEEGFTSRNTIYLIKDTYIDYILLKRKKIMYPNLYNNFYLIWEKEIKSFLTEAKNGEDFDKIKEQLMVVKQETENIC